MKKLNLGCGDALKSKEDGWINSDFCDGKGIDLVLDLNTPNYPFEDNSIDEIYSSCVLEHVKNLGNLSSECYRILKTNGKISMKCDHAGYLGLYLFKRMEHNQILHNNYMGSNFHEKLKNIDRHFCLFVPSHLKYLFQEFREIKITYPSPARAKWKNFLLNLIPFNLGKQHIQIDAIK